MTLIVAAQQIRKALKQYGWSIQDDHHASDSNSHYFRAERESKNNTGQDFRPSFSLLAQ